MLKRYGIEDFYTFLFPGVGMKFNKFLGSLDGLDLNGLMSACRETEKILGIDISDYITGKEEAYRDKEFVEQISIYTLNCFIFHEYVKKGIKPGVLLGYSMGMYSAFYCSGSLNYKDGLDLVVAAYNLMKDFSGKKEKWGMAVIVGLNFCQVKGIIDKLKMHENVYIINENSQYSIVISGRDQGINDVCSSAVDEGALNVTRLNISIPYHTMFMNDSAESFNKYFKKIEFKNPLIPVISAITQNTITTAEEVKRDLFLNIKSSMSWLKTIEKAATMGFNKYFEVGLTDSLCKMSAFINPGYKFFCSKDVFREAINSAG